MPLYRPLGTKMANVYGIYTIHYNIEYTFIFNMSQCGLILNTVIIIRTSWFLNTCSCMKRKNINRRTATLILGPSSVCHAELKWNEFVRLEYHAFITIFNSCSIRGWRKNERIAYGEWDAGGIEFLWCHFHGTRTYISRASNYSRVSELMILDYSNLW